MKIVMFYHSLISDWNHGNAHFLRGIATELIKRGNQVIVYEPEDSWSRMNLIKDTGSDFSNDFSKYYPFLQPNYYSTNTNLKSLVIDADIVIVHEWNDHNLVSRLGALKEESDFRIFFHDTHHRAVTDKNGIGRYELSNYDGVIAFGDIIKDMYLKNNWIKKAWTVHEAADVNIFKPLPSHGYEGDVIWIGNWGDEERSEEIREFLISPVKELKLKCKVYGVRYPRTAIDELNSAGIVYGGWLPNYKVPEIFSGYKITMHIPRGPYAKVLKGIPTIRPFEAMACGIPLVSTEWEDSEHLFTPGKDFLYATDRTEMIRILKELLSDETLSNSLALHARKTILAKHTCAHRVDQLLDIFAHTEIKEISPGRN